MTIKEVCKKFNVTQDTLRYYERIGMIPYVTREKSGIRNYQDRDLKWVELAVCMRNAGVSVETMIEYVKLFQEGDSTIEARHELLSNQKENLLEQRKKIEKTLEKLDYEISRYEIAMETGNINWEDCEYR